MLLGQLGVNAPAPVLVDSCPLPANKSGWKWSRVLTYNGKFTALVEMPNIFEFDHNHRYEFDLVSSKHGITHCPSKIANFYEFLASVHEMCAGWRYIICAKGGKILPITLLWSQNQVNWPKITMPVWKGCIGREYLTRTEADWASELLHPPACPSRVAYIDVIGLHSSICMRINVRQGMSTQLFDDLGRHTTHCGKCVTWKIKLSASNLIGKRFLRQAVEAAEGCQVMIHSYNSLNHYVSVCDIPPDIAKCLGTLLSPADIAMLTAGAAAGECDITYDD